MNWGCGNTGSKEREKTMINVCVNARNVCPRFKLELPGVDSNVGWMERRCHPKVTATSCNGIQQGGRSSVAHSKMAWRVQ
jgi:hypothetical protein